MSHDGPECRTAQEYYADKAHADRWQRTHGEWAPDLPPPMVAGRPVRLERCLPPIPIRDYDWRATWVDYEGGDPQGFGRTREAALADLREQCEE